MRVMQTSAISLVRKLILLVVPNGPIVCEACTLLTLCQLIGNTCRGEDLCIVETTGISNQKWLTPGREVISLKALELEADQHLLE
jgi:hypothetical protein